MGKYSHVGNEEIVQLDYQAMEDMVRMFKQGAEQLQDTMQEMQSIANLLSDGALKGQAGEALVDAVRGPLSSAISRLVEKFNEEANDVQEVIHIIQDKDRSIAHDF